GTRWRAQRRRVEVGVAQPALGQAGDVRGLNEPTKGVAPAETDIIQHDVHDVRRALRRLGGNRERRLGFFPGPADPAGERLPPRGRSSWLTPPGSGSSDM